MPTLSMSAFGGEADIHEPRSKAANDPKRTLLSLELFALRMMRMQYGPAKY